MLKGSIDTGTHVVVYVSLLTSSHKLLIGLSLQVLHGVRNSSLVWIVEVGILPGLSQNFDDMIYGALWVSSKQHSWFLHNELAQEVVLLSCLLSIVSDWKVGYPFLGQLVVNWLVGLDQLFLVLKNLTKRSDRVVSSMMILSLLFVFITHCLWHWEVNGLIQGSKAHFTVSAERSTTVLSNNTNSIGRSLSKTGTLVIGILNNCLDNHHILVCSEVLWSQVLNHVIQDKETKFKSLLDARNKGLMECFGSQGVN